MKRTLAAILGLALVSSTLIVRAQQRGVPQSAGAPEPSEPPNAPRLDTLKLPPGFSIQLFAENVVGARSMALAPDGTLFVSTRNGRVVYAVIDGNRDHRADEVLTVASDLNTPNGIAFRDGSLYVAELSRVLRFDHILENVKSRSLAAHPAVLIDELPSDRLHGWKYLAFGPDGLLYLQVGAPCNICERPDPYASILRMRPNGSGLEVFARGVRNSVGLAWHPDTGELWFTDNGRDMLGDERPNDELNHAPRAGMHFGYPYCHEGEILDPEFGAGKSCDDYTPPAQKLGPHVAALGLKFYTGTMFPQEYRKQLFIVNHGSWNRSAEVDHTGYRIMLATIEGDKVTGYEPFITGWLEGRQAWGRPVDLLVMPDGSMLVSDDRANVVYRVTYGQ